MSFDDCLYYAVELNYAPIIKCTENFDEECELCWSREVKHLDFLLRKATSTSAILNMSPFTQDLHDEVLDLLMLPKDTVLTTK